MQKQIGTALVCGGGTLVAALVLNSIMLQIPMRLFLDITPPGQKIAEILGIEGVAEPGDAAAASALGLVAGTSSIVAGLALKERSAG